MTLAARPASPEDAAILAQIYNEGIADRVGTFETRPRTAQDVMAWFDGVHPIVVVEADGLGVIAFASTSSYRSRECYAGIAEFSVYVARQARGQGAHPARVRAKTVEAPLALQFVEDVLGVGAFPIQRLHLPGVGRGFVEVGHVGGELVFHLAPELALRQINRDAGRYQ